MSSGRRAYDLLRSYVTREYDRLKDLDLLQARDELDAPTIPNSPNPTSTQRTEPETDPSEKARKILGVEPTADFEAIRKAFDRLNKRADPSRFPEASPERELALQLQGQINWAYRTLTADVDATEKRFKSLEIE